MINVAIERHSRFTRPTFGGVRLYSAALLTLGAALIHLAAAPAHLSQYLPFGLFFLAIGSLASVLAGEVVARPTHGLVLTLALSNLALVGLWFVSRTVGLPIGPEPGVPEAVSVADVMCLVME